MQTSPDNQTKIEAFLTDLREPDRKATRHWLSFIAVKHSGGYVLLAGQITINGVPPDALPVISHEQIIARTIELSENGLSYIALIEQALQGTLRLPDLDLAFPYDGQNHMVFYTPDVRFPEAERSIEGVLQISGVQRHEIIDYVGVDLALSSYPGFYSNLHQLLCRYQIKEGFGAIGLWLISAPSVTLSALAPNTASPEATLHLRLRPSFEVAKVSIGVRPFRAGVEMAPLTVSPSAIEWEPAEKGLTGTTILPLEDATELLCIAIYDGATQQIQRFEATRKATAKPSTTAVSAEARRSKAKTTPTPENPKSTRMRGGKASNRDDFTPATKRALGLRAGHLCSMPNCNVSTAGPSDESAAGVMSIGVAAHIASAAQGPGARRFDPNMTPEERSGIENGIWLCQSCAKKIDDDEAYYSAIRLKEYKASHEARCRLHPDRASESMPGHLIAMGPELVVIGKIVGATSGSYRLQVQRFAIGSEQALVRFATDFERTNPRDRYVLLNEIGIGHRMASAPEIESIEGGLVLKLAVEPSIQRRAIAARGISMCRHTGKGITGLPAFVQDLEICLGSALGESPFSPRSGSRISEYFYGFGGTALLEPLIKLELVRLASLRTDSRLYKSEFAPLSSISAVKSVAIIYPRNDDRYLKARVTLDVEGVGEWQDDIDIFIHTPEELETARTRSPFPGLNVDD